MIQEKDVDTFLKAKKEEWAIILLQVLSMVSLTTLVIRDVMDMEQNYTMALAWVSWFAMGAAMGQSKWVSVSRGHLLEILERLMNHDAEALKFLAAKRGKRNSANEFA